MDYGGGMGGWGWLFGALILVGLVLLVVVAVRRLGGGSGGTGHAPHPAPREDPRAGARALLDERYARGEISTEEYRERRQALDEGS